jgi:hypothetical protein
MLEEISDDEPDCDSDRDIAYYMRGRGRLLCRLSRVIP